jgi:hypothetical protein
MKKLPVFLFAAATALTVAGVPMTAQAATCSRTTSNCYTSNCSNQYGNLNSLLSCYGTKGSNTTTGNNNSSNCVKGKTTCNINFSQCGSFARYCR